MAITPFQSRVRPTVVAKRSTAQVSGIGEALSMLGRTSGQIADDNAQTAERVASVDHQIAMRERDRADDDLALAVAVEHAKATQRLRIFDEENQTAADYATRKAAEVEKEVSALRGMIGSNDRVNKRFLPTLTTFAETEKADAIVYATRVRAKATGEAYQATAETLANIAYSDPAKAEPGIAMLVESVRGSTFVDDALKPALERKLLEPIRVRQLEGAVDQGKFDTVIKELDEGTFDTVIGPDQKKRLKKYAETEKAEFARATEEAALVKRDEARSSAKLIKARIDAGQVVDPKEFDAVVAGMKAAGVDAAEIVTFESMSTQNRVNRTYSPTVDPMGTMAAGAAKALEAKVMSGKATAEEEMRYTHLVEISRSRAAEFGKGLNQTAAQGVQGKQQVLGQLSSLPADQRFTAAQAAAPGLGYLALMTEPVQAGALRGMEDLAANPKLIDSKKASEAFGAATRTARLGLNEEAVQGHMQVANALYVDWTKQAGASEAEFNPSLYQKAVRMAFGGVQRNGEWQGGLGLHRGRSVILPDGYSEQRFDREISRLTFADAVYADGSKASKSDVLANYAPVYVGDNDVGKPVYVFRDRAGKELKMKDGRAFPVAMP